MICFSLFLILFILNVVTPISATISNSHAHEVTSDSALTEYEAVRNKCNWESAEVSRCGIATQYCYIDATVAEGSGYYFISRYGPITTTGGNQNVECANRHSPSPEPGTWLTRAMTAPIDPYTGDILDFPPVHLHHSNLRNTDQPPIPKDLLNQMPWMNSAEEITYAIAWSTTSAADNICVPQQQGKACWMKFYPSGYGRKVYNKQRALLVNFHIQDSRLSDSPPITTYLENAQFYVKQPNPQLPPLKHTLDFILGCNAMKAPHTYEVKYNTSMYQFITYYFSMTVDVILTHFHGHSINGDEAWLIRGSQSDIGIPRQLHREVDALDGGKKVGPTHPPVALVDGDTLIALRQRMEESLKQSQLLYQQRTAEQQRQQHHHPQMTVRINGKQRSFGYAPYRKGDSQKYSPQVAKVKPEVLCKYRAENAIVTKEDIEAMRKKWYDRYNALFDQNNRNEGFRQPPLRGSEPIPYLPQEAIDERITSPSVVDQMNYKLESPNFKPPGFEAVTAKEQADNLFQGVLPGEYYRHMMPYYQSHDADHGNATDAFDCQQFTIRAGEYITLVHFLEPRVAPKATNIYDGLETTMNQHTLFLMEGSIRDFPYT